MMGNYDGDPKFALKRGQTVAELVADIKKLRGPKKQARRPMGEDRKVFLRMMGLGKWIK